MRHLLIPFLIFLLAAPVTVWGSTPTATADAALPHNTSRAFKARDISSSVHDDDSCKWVDERQLESCLSEKFKRADSDLNITYKEIMVSLDKNLQIALRKEERTWIKWRETECARQAKEVEGCVHGCGVPHTMYVVCMTKEAKNRVNQMKNQWRK